MSFSPKGEISTLLCRAMVSAFLVACEILFQALGAVYKKGFFVYVLILAFVHIGSSYSKCYSLIRQISL